MFEKLVAIQQELKAPKNQYNKFGKYKYRSLEDILEAVKPLLKKHKVALMLNDCIKDVGGVPYVEATAELKAVDGDDAVYVNACAGIDVNKKGMDYAQSFGASSSYARKYALNGLFLIDDTKDADATNTHGAKAKSEKPGISSNSDVWEKAVSYIEGGGDVNTILNKYSLTEGQKSFLKGVNKVKDNI